MQLLITSNVQKKSETTWPTSRLTNDTIFEHVRCLKAEDWDLLNKGAHGSFTGQKSAILKAPFDLPISDSGELFVYGSGNIQGSLQIVEDATLVDSARIDMRVDYYEKGSDALSNVEICNLAIKGMSNGIEIYVSFRSSSLISL